MFMVVYSHIISFGLTAYNPSPIGTWMKDTMLPLFFFISGFVAYKSTVMVGFKEYGCRVLRKFSKMLVPTILMMGVMMWHTHANWAENLFSYDKGGYWYTLVLFQIFVIYLPFLMLTRYVKDPLLKVMILVSPFIIMTMIFRFIDLQSKIAVLFECIKVKGFYRFFILGAITNLLMTEKTLLFSYCLHTFPKVIKPYILSALFVLALLFTHYWGGKLLTQVLSLYLVFFAFKELDPWLNKEKNRFCYILSTIGCNTLPIYLLHFFLLFRLPESVVMYLVGLQSDYCFGSNSCCSLVEFLIVGICALLICYASILISCTTKKIFPQIAKIFLGI